MVWVAIDLNEHPRLDLSHHLVNQSNGNIAKLLYLLEENLETTYWWDYYKNYLIDHEHGGWYRLGTNAAPEAANGDKGGIWKGNYHNARSLINCLKLLRKSDLPHS